MPDKTQQKNSHIPGLDGLRGLAAMFVYFAHSSLGDVSIIPWFDCTWFGKIGVFIFFLLSAFLISVPFLSDKPGIFSNESMKRYMKRRIMRIYPLYAFYLICALVTTWASYAILEMNRPDGVPLTLDLRRFLEHVTLQRGDGVTWSIAVEFKFYFILPFIMAGGTYLLKSGKSLWIAPVILVLLVAASYVAFPYSEMAKNDVSLKYYLPIFLIGIICALAFKKGSMFRSPKSLKFLDILGLFCFAASIASSPPIIKLFGVDQEHRNVLQEMLLQSVIFVPVVMAVAYRTKFTSLIFENHVLRFLGMISFSLYLWHPMFLNGIPRLLTDWHPLLIAWITLACTIAWSFLSYQIIERPFLSSTPTYMDFIMNKMGMVRYFAYARR